MTNIVHLTAAALAAILLTTGVGIAEDPPGSTSTGPRPLDTGPTMVMPLPNLPPAPTDIGIGRMVPPPSPDFDDIRSADDDWVFDRILLGADDLRYPHDVCYGLITCCNSEWVQGCADFANVCTIYGGVVQTVMFSDGSTQYECHEAE